MSQEVLSCYKYIKSKPISKVYLLLCSASFSIFWMMAFSSSAAIARVNSSSTNPKYNIQDLENSFIEQTTIGGVSNGKKSSSARTNELKNQSHNQSDLPALAAQDVSQVGLESESPRQVKGFQGCKIGRSCQQTTQISQVPAATFNQQFNPQTLPQQQSPNTGRVQEFVAPRIANSGGNPQPYIAPLPPLPGTQPQPRQPLGVNSQPTFNQLLYSPTNQVSSGVSASPTLSNNPLLNSATTQPAVTTRSIPTFNQTSNYQAPNYQTSTYQTPNYQAPNYQNPTYQTSIYQTPNYQTPNYQTSTYQTSTYQTPNYQTPNYQAPTLPAPVNQGTPVAPTVQPSVVPMGAPSPSVVAQPVEQKQVQQVPIAVKRQPAREPSVTLQGVYVTQGDDTSARARVTGIYPLTPQALFGATLDLTSEGSSLDDSRGEGLNINELYFATSLGGLPNLRFVVGQMDLTSYFDRNSFAKDGASQFFNPVFQTNPALSATGISSHPGLLVNWSVTDNITAKAAVFSSSDALSDFSLDGFAGEIGVRYGNAIIRGTYSSARDGGNRDSFPESFGIARGNNRFGPLEDDREEAYGLNAEVFIPNLKLGLFGRYGRYENRDLGEGADTYSLGLSFLDLLTPDDRLGLAYGRALSNDALRRGEQPDVLELFYDFKVLPNLRLGFSFQGRDSFEESVLGVRVKSDFDITPKRRGTR